MASLEHDRSGNYLVRFRWGGKPFKRSLDTRDTTVAEAGLARVEETILRLKRGWLAMPADAEPGLFIVSGGVLTTKPVVSESCREDVPTLGTLVDQYLGDPPASKEPGTLKVERSYLRNLVRIMGADRPLRAIDLQAAQAYGRRRLSESRGGGKAPKPYTVRKELKTLRYVWERAVKLGSVSDRPPWQPRDLDLPKDEESEHWMTYDAIKARIDRGGLSESDECRLWSRLFLTDGDLRDVLDHVGRQETDPWVYPAIVFAALTGARRSEILRSEIDDFDFEAGSVRIREKKRDRNKRLTTRVVDLHPLLVEVMRAWLARHPGGQWTLCRPDGEPIDVDMMDNRLEAVLKGSRWSVIRGWHAFRHSFISILASHGVDQRVIDSFVGHQTEEMRRRYRHLFPKTLRSAILTLLPENTV